MNENNSKKSSIFIAYMTIWPNIISTEGFILGQATKWHNIVVMSLKCYMISPGLYDSPDSTMETVQKSPQARLASCPPVRLVHSPKLRRLDLCCDKLSPKAEIVE